jgi:hypothetical protein
MGKDERKRNPSKKDVENVNKKTKFLTFFNIIHIKALL